MIAAWNEAHPEAPVSTVQQLDPVTWEERLATAARSGTLRIAEWAPRLNDAANQELRAAAAAGSELLDNARP
ncbi:MAG: hypothetical protein ABSB63_08660 [Spirochaetia bacterium]|jgi:hypothetical protein